MHLLTLQPAKCARLITERSLEEIEGGLEKEAIFEKKRFEKETCYTLEQSVSFFREDAKKEGLIGAWVV